MNFDLNFPRLPSDLKTYADNKIRLLHQDQSELNRQVFGLVVFGTFLPADASFGNNSQLRSGSINTVAGTVSSYLSNFFNKLLGEYVNGVDVEIGYNVYEFDKVAAGTDPTRQFGQQFRARGNYDFNEKWSIGAGLAVESGNITQNVNSSSGFFGYDFFSGLFNQSGSPFEIAPFLCP